MSSTLHITVRAGGRPHEIEVTTTNDMAAVSAWLSAHVFAGSASRRLLGFDTESRPVFQKGQTSTVSVMQLATETAVLVAHIGAHARGGLDAVHRLLSDDAVVLCGMSVGPDVSALAAAVGFGGRPRLQTVELKTAATRAGIFVNGGLLGLATETLDVEKWKSKKLQMSRWDMWPISEPQIRYAALDAWMGRASLAVIEGRGGDDNARARAAASSSAAHARLFGGAAAPSSAGAAGGGASASALPPPHASSAGGARAGGGGDRDDEDYD
jgi:hypothetical protein